MSAVRSALLPPEAPSALLRGAWDDGGVAWIRKLGRGEGPVLIVALGVALGLLGEYTIASLDSPIGWVAYAPLSQTTPAGSVPRWGDYLILLGFAGLWVVVSFGILRAGRSQPPTSN